MLRIFSLSILLIFVIQIDAWAVAKVPDTLEQINADLLAKKAQNDPFYGKTVKVDLESLGLDPIDEKDAASTAEKNKTVAVEPIKVPTKEVEKSKIVDVKNVVKEVAKVASVPTSAPILQPTKTPAVKAPVAVIEPIKAPIKEEIKSKLIDVKVDVKNVPATKELPKSDVPKIPLPDKINPVTKEVKQVGESKSADTKSVGDNAVSKIQNFLQKTAAGLQDQKELDKKDVAPIAPPSTLVPATTTTDTKITEKDPKQDAKVNAEKKRNLKKQLAAKKAAKKKMEENEKKRLKKLAKLKELREKYLIKISSEKSVANKNLDEDLVENEDKIVPQKKEINKFVSYETPAPPILNRYRTHDNIGIPIILSQKEKIDILFKAIDQKDISYFNSAYADLESPDIKNFSGDTVLTYAILLQKHEVVASILSKGANPNLANSLGYTPLNIAIEMLDSTSFNLLVNANADVNYIDGFGRTYLMHAARVGFLTGADLLIEKGVDVNAMDNDGFTALAIAYRHKRDLIVALLLKNGAKTWIEKSYDPKVESMMQELENRWNKN